jgi:SagB-type dehydrogenase family enzyme
MEKSKSAEKTKALCSEFRNILKTGFARLDEHVSDQQLGVEVPPMQNALEEGAALIELPQPESVELKEKNIFNIIKNRISHRKFKDESITLEELSYLLWATQGVKETIRDNKISKRTVPSGGSRHPFETYLAVFNVEGLKEGLYRYLPFGHKLVFHKEVPYLSERVIKATLGQKFSGECSVTFFWSVVPYRTEWRYTVESKKIILQDCGHMGQNLYLACGSVGCGTCAIGAYDQLKCDELLELDGTEEFTIYISPVGRI